MKSSSDNNNENSCPLEFSIKINKQEYVINEQVLGFITILLRDETPLTNIKLKLKQREFWNQAHNHFVKEKTILKTQIEINNYLTEHQEDNNKHNTQVKLSAGVYMFPFSFSIPEISLQTLEYSDNDIKTYIRTYMKFSFMNNSPYYCDYPINITREIPTEEKIEFITKKTDIYKWGMFSSGSINLTIKSDSLLYKIGSSAKVNIDIDNTSDLKIKNVKLSLYRKFSLYSGQGLVYTKKYKINTNTINIKCKAREKKNIEGTIIIDDCLLLEEKMQVINHNKDSYANITLLIPSISSQVLQCEYYIKVTAYSDDVVFKKSRPRCLLPIQVIY